LLFGCGFYSRLTLGYDLEFADVVGDRRDVGGAEFEFECGFYVFSEAREGIGEGGGAGSGGSNAGFGIDDGADEVFVLIPPQDFFEVVALDDVVD
jgi:hypothetical protein